MSNNNTATAGVTGTAAVLTMNTSKYNWGDELKVAVGDLKVTTNATGGNGAGRGPIPEGRYAAYLSEVKHGTFKKGSYGMTFTFTIEGGAANNRSIREYVVLKKADGTNTQYGALSLKRRLMAFGLPIEKINAFKGPRNEHDLGDFKLCLSAPVTIVVKADGEYEGRPSRKIAGVYLREVIE